MKRVLIIEDDQLVANIYRNKFSVDHFETEVAFDGESGFDMIKTFQPDVIILDLMLPKVTGLDLLKRIRGDSGMAELPVIVFSNTYLSNMVQEAWKAGATKCLSKANCTPKQVIEVVRSLSAQPVGAMRGASGGTAAAEAGASRAAQTAPEPDLASASTDSDAEFQEELRRSFLASLPGTIAACRMNLQSLAKSPDEAGKLQFLQELYRRVHTVTGNAGIAGLLPISQLADALEALVKELSEKPQNITASTLRTVASAIDFLHVLYEHCRKPGSPGAQAHSKADILVVDDEAISRRAVTYALEKARLPCTALESPEAALQMLAERKFDLIFLDVDMPGMNGFELCTKVRTQQRNKSTPIVFVTSLTDFESRANSTMSGGNDLIAKPFLFIELTVKAVIYILRGKIAAAGNGANAKG